MQFGLFGKLQAKRDFIAVRVPRSFLTAFEPWMQSCISTSRMALGGTWQSAFLTAPIWRFWLGADLCGTVVAGAFMASMDGIGRYSPLAFVAVSEPDDILPPPEFAPCEAWYAQIENFLLSTLESGQSFEQTIGELAAFKPPAIDLPPASAQVQRLAEGGIVGRADADFAALFTQMRRMDPMMAHAASTFWWTAGGEGFAPRAIAALRMPDPTLFASMLTGDFRAGAAGGEVRPDV